MRPLIELAQKLKRRIWPIHLDALKDPAEAYYGGIYLSHIDRYLGTLPEDELQILDAGCGTGRMTVPLARRGHRITAVDFHRHSLKLLRSNLADADAGEYVTIIDRELGDAVEELSLNAFDVVLSIEVLYSSQNLTSMITALRDRLKPGGLMLVSHRTKYYYILSCLAGGHVEKAKEVAMGEKGYLPKGFHTVLYNWQSRQELEDLYEAVGMEVLGMHPIGAYSGFGIDPLTGICDPGELEPSDRQILHEIEMAAGEDHLMASRYVLVCSRKLANGKTGS